MSPTIDPRASSGPCLTAQQCADFANVLNRKYAAFLTDRRFSVESARNTLGVTLKVTLQNATGSFYYPVEGRICFVDHDLSAFDAGMMVLDYIDAYFDEYLRAGDVYLPIDWTDYEIDGIPLQLKGQVLNLEIERLGDLWLEGLAPGQEAPHGESTTHAPDPHDDAAARH